MADPSARPAPRCACAYHGHRCGLPVGHLYAHHTREGAVGDVSWANDPPAIAGPSAGSPDARADSSCPMSPTGEHDVRCVACHQVVHPGGPSAVSPLADVIERCAQIAETMAVGPWGDPHDALAPGSLAKMIARAIRDSATSFPVYQCEEWQCRYVFPDGRCCTLPKAHVEHEHNPTAGPTPVSGVRVEDLEKIFVVEGNHEYGEVRFEFNGAAMDISSWDTLHEAQSAQRAIIEAVARLRGPAAGAEAPQEPK